MDPRVLSKNRPTSLIQKIKTICVTDTKRRRADYLFDCESKECDLRAREWDDEDGEDDEDPSLVQACVFQRCDRFCLHVRIPIPGNRKRWDPGEEDCFGEPFGCVRWRRYDRKQASSTSRRGGAFVAAAAEEVFLRWVVSFRWEDNQEKLTSPVPREA